MVAGIIARFQDGGPGFSLFRTGKSYVEMQAEYSEESGGSAVVAAASTGDDAASIKSASEGEKANLKLAAVDAPSVAAIQQPVHSQPQSQSQQVQQTPMSMAASGYAVDPTAGGGGVGGGWQSPYTILANPFFSGGGGMASSRTLANPLRGDLGGTGRSGGTSTTVSGGDDVGPAVTGGGGDVPPPPAYLLTNPLSEKMRNKQWKSRMMYAALEQGREQ